MLISNTYHVTVAKNRKLGKEVVITMIVWPVNVSIR